MEEYSRDVMAKPLLALGVLLQDVRSGRFNPDATRSGRWQPREPEAAHTSAGSEPAGGSRPLPRADEHAAPSAMVADALAEASEDIGPEGKGSSGGESSDTTDKEDSAEEEAADRASRTAEDTGYPEMPSGGIWHGSARGCLHRGLGEDTLHAACGYGLKWVTARWTSEWPAGARPLCRRSSCFPL